MNCNLTEFSVLILNRRHVFCGPASSKTLSLLCASEQVCLDGGVRLSVESGQDPSERSTHTVCRLPGLQNLLSLDGGLGHGRVGWTQGGPAGRLQPLEDRRAGAVGVAAVGGSRAGTQARGASQVPAGRAWKRSRAVGGGAAGRVFGLVV